MNDAIASAADELRRQLQEKVEHIKAHPDMVEVLKLHSALNTLEGLAGAEMTSLSATFGLDTGAKATILIRPDEFYGLQALDAAKKYIKKRGEARPFDEIVTAIEDGGAGRIDKDQLRLSLSRSTYEIAKVGTDLYGLVEFYPHIKRGRKKKDGAPIQADEEPDKAEEADNGKEEPKQST